MTEPATQAAPVAQPTPNQPQPVTVEAAKAAALGQSPEATEATSEATPDPWSLEQQPVKPTNVRERLLAKQTRLAEQQQAQTLQAQLSELKTQYEGLTARQQQAVAESQRLLSSGDVDGALKVAGLPISFEELQRAELIRRGALQATPRDPKVEQLEQELKAMKEAEAKRQEQFRMQQARAEQARQYQEDLRAVETELASLSLPGAADFAKIAGVKEAVLSVMMRDQNLTLDQAAKIVRRDYEALAQQLVPLARPAQSAPAVQQSSVQQRLSAGRESAAVGAVPLATAPEGLSLKERLAYAKRVALNGGVP